MFEEALRAISRAFDEMVNGRLYESETLTREASELIEQYESSFSQAESDELQARLLTQRANIAAANGENTIALEQFSNALALAQRGSLDELTTACLCNIGNVYSAIGDIARGLEFYQQALELCVKIENVRYHANILCNIAGIELQLGNMQNVLARYHEALEIYRRIEYAHGTALILANLGGVYGENKQHEEALAYFFESLEVSDASNDKRMILLALDGLATIYSNPDYSGCNYTRAEEFLNRARVICEEMDSKKELYSIHKTFAVLYKNQERYKEALEHFELYHELERETLSLEAKLLADKIGYEREVEQKERAIELERAQSTTRLNLLHRVLPHSIAKRIIDDETEIADYFPMVSILFADIKGFTTLSSRMPAHAVVKFLGNIFLQFDDIMKKHECEKIKTIGDGYMAVCGAPDAREDHAERIIGAAFDILHTLKFPPEFAEYYDSNEEHGVRIGIHCGPVVAGVVGQDRFVYDVYSDAVNIASRMESHGDVSRIHVSNDFVEHLQLRLLKPENRDLKVHCIDRGKIEVRGKGQMQTFFVEKHG